MAANGARPNPPSGRLAPKEEFEWRTSDHQSANQPPAADGISKGIRSLVSSNGDNDIRSVSLTQASEASLSNRFCLKVPLSWDPTTISDLPRASSEETDGGMTIMSKDSHDSAYLSSSSSPLPPDSISSLAESFYVKSGKCASSCHCKLL